MTCHAQMYSRTAGRHFEVSISYLIATLGLAYNEVSLKYQSKTPNPGMLFFNLVFKVQWFLNFPKWTHVNRNSFTCSHFITEHTTFGRPFLTQSLYHWTHYIRQTVLDAVTLSLNTLHSADSSWRSHFITEHTTFDKPFLTQSLYHWTHYVRQTVLESPSVKFRQLPNANVVVCAAVVDVRGTTKVQVVVTAQSPNALWNIRLAQINCSSVRIPGKQARIFTNVAAWQEARQTPSSLILRYQCVRGNCRLHLRSKEGHGSGMRKGQWHCNPSANAIIYTFSLLLSWRWSSRFLQRVGTYLPKCTASRTSSRAVSQPKAPDTMLSQFCPIHVLSIQCMSLRAICFLMFQAAAFHKTSPPNLRKSLTSQCA